MHQTIQFQRFGIFVEPVWSLYIYVTEAEQKLPFKIEKLQNSAQIGKTFAFMRFLKNLLHKKQRKQ